jgi:hypothetical protein
VKYFADDRVKWLMDVSGAAWCMARFVFKNRHYIDSSRY